MAKKNLFWLASYPKSGNTWLRAFIAAINDMDPIDESGRFARAFSQCGDRSIFEQVFRGDVPPETTADMKWRLPFQRQLSARIGMDTHYVKTHCTFGPYKGARLFEPEVSRHVVFIVRNPFDVCVSLANHYGVNNQIAMGIMANPVAMLSKNSPRNFETPLGDWNSYTLSWLRQKDIPMTVLRYEDMYFDRERVFSEFARTVLGIDDDARIAAALDKSHFSSLKDKEDSVGFDERSTKAERFFWKGYPYHALETLNRKLQKLIWKQHGPVAQMLGYAYDGETITLKQPRLAA